MNTMKNYSHSGHSTTSNSKWTRPVIVPEYEEAKSYNGLIMLGMLLIAIAVIAVIVVLM